MELALGKAADFSALDAGTRRYGDCTRQLLLDSATVARILGYLITLPPTSPSAPSEQLPALQPVSLRDYYNVSLVEYSGRKKIEAKMWNLNGTNRRRASKASEREEKLELAREAAEEGEGKVVAISMVLHEKGRRRRVRQSSDRCDRATANLLGAESRR